MKRLVIPELPVDLSRRPVDTASLFAALDDEGAEAGIESLAWPAFPDRPEVSLRAGWQGDALALRFRVKEREILGTRLRDGEEVYRDSCVEFFVSPEGAGHYYNFEFNCLGTCLACVGPNRRERESIGNAALKSIVRIPSLGRNPVRRPAVPGRELQSWQLTVIIPAGALVREKPGGFSGFRGTGNFYKCGDDLERPHYLSWNPIGTPEPDFHRPEYFGGILFTDR